jgi:RNA recognition motif-containing protein
MGNKLYVGNLPYSTTEDSLKDLFSQAGSVVSAKIIFDRQSGRSKGFGFVEMESDQDANTGIEKFDGYDLDGRKLKVSIARPKTDSR